MATRAKQRKAEQPEAEQPAFKPDYGAVLKEVSKKFKTSSGSMSLEARLSCTVSTGLLSSDLMLGGGLVAGRWYTVFGGEGSAKSTHVAHIKIAAADLDVPVMQDLDYEGSSDPIYYEGIMEFYSKMRKITDLYGLKDEASGEWIIQPRVDYQQVTVAEDFFNPAAALLRRIPDKVYVDGRWWYSWADDKYGRGMSKGQHSPAMLREYNRLMIEAENGLPQAIYFLDSYPAMYPDRLDEDDAGSGMAAVARAMAENIPKVLGKLRPKGVIIVGVNQLRQRPAVMYGCLHYDTPIHFVDGRIIPIGQVVAERIQGEVWSWNETTCELEPKQITAWHNNGVVPDGGWVTVNTQGLDTDNGVVSATVTPNHEVLTNNGWKEAGNLDATDMVLTKYNSVLCGDRAAFIAGMVSGDCAIASDKRSLNSSLHLQDNENPEYVQWKLDNLGLDYTKYPSTRGCIYVVHPSAEWTFIKNELGARQPFNFVDLFTSLSLAILYMDDGHFRADRRSCTFSFKRFKNSKTELDKVLKVFAKFGIRCKYYISAGLVALDTEATDKLHRLICKYVPDCMQYKLLPTYRGNYIVGAADVSMSGTTCAEAWAPVLSVHLAGKRNYRASVNHPTRGLYDITVEGNHNYLAGKSTNGFIVHNSPEYEPGGETLKFASSVRVRQAARSVPHGKGPIEEEDSVLYERAKDQYRYIHMKAIKNKVSTPYLESWQRVWVNDGAGQAHGFDPVWDTFQFLKTTGQLGAGSTMKKLKIPALGLDKPISWLDFKELVLLRGNDLKSVCRDLGITKPPKLRDMGFKQLDTGQAQRMFFEHQRGAESDESDED